MLEGAQYFLMRCTLRDIAVLGLYNCKSYVPFVWRINGVILWDNARFRYPIEEYIHCNFSTNANLTLISFVQILLNKNSEQPQETGEGGEAPPGGITDADIDSNWDEAIDSFDGMEIPEELLRGIYAYGFEKPSAIQQRAIKPTMLGRDLIAQAQSGTVSFTTFLFGVVLDVKDTYIYI